MTTTTTPAALTEAERDRLAALGMQVVRRAVWSFRREYRRLDPDELESAGALALARAIDAYDPARGVPFTGYVSRVVWRALLDVARDRRRERDPAAGGAAVLALGDLRELVAPPEAPDPDEQQQGPPPSWLDRLTEDELELARMRADGLGHKAIGQQIGVSKNTVRTWLQLLRAKIERLLGDEDDG